LIILGAGMAGLLSANILRSFQPKVWEAQDSLPNNHEALLRFRTDKVGSACAIPFKKVKVNKAIKYDGKITTQPDLFLSNLYSQKVTGGVWSRSINDLSAAERYIAPLNLISQMAVNCNISYGKVADEFFLDEHAAFDKHVPIISTIPMPVLMKLVGWEDLPDFGARQIWTQRAIIDEPHCDVYQTIYYPDHFVPQYRVSVVGNVVISELASEPHVDPGKSIMEILREDFGINARRLVGMKTSSQKYGKITPIDEKIRQEFIFEMTTRYNLYSVGRFATWRQLLLDDVVGDIQKIEQFIRGNSDYHRKMKSQKGADQ